MLLLDTHCWLWLKAEPERLPSALRRRLLKNPSKLVLSASCILEIAIKSARGRLKLQDDPAMLVAQLLEDGVVPLNATVAHALRLTSLPPLHRDPFDRLLIAQTITEEALLLSIDDIFRRYDVPLL